MMVLVRAVVVMLMEVMVVMVEKVVEAVVVLDHSQGGLCLPNT